ncbi:hypothetical protein MKX01_013120 [Papaver californicum]|nr:hypothetical protein MKX01_013120 [Papaver californicum]
MVTLSKVFQKFSDYCREMFKDSSLDNLDLLSTSFCRTPLHIAVMSGDIKFATKILSLKPHLAMIIDSNGYTPLHLASVRTNLQIVKLLLKVRPGACVVQDEDGRTPLHLAAMKDRVEIMKLLLEDGLSDAIHIKNDEGTILHLCVKSNGTIETLELLVNKLVLLVQTPRPNSISINSKDSDDKTILQLAAEMGKFEDEHVNGSGDINSRNCFPSNVKPARGFWQDDTKVDSGTDPITFTYYLDHMFGSAVTGSLETYIQDYLGHTAIRNKGSSKNPFVAWNGTQKNVKDFVEALMDSPDFSRTSKGLILEDYNFTSVVSNYNNSNGTGNFSPYLIRYAGYPMLAYRNPMIYTLYMNTNTVAFLLSVMLIVLVLSGFVDDYHLRPLVVLMCISTLCIAFSYISILYTIRPVFYVEEPTRYSLYGYLGLNSFYGIIIFIWIIISRMDKLRNRHLIGSNYLTAFVSMKPITAGKVIIWMFGYCATIFAVFYSSKAFIVLK